MTATAARRVEIEQSLDDLVRQGVGPENANYRKLVSERDSLDTVMADHAARVAQHERAMTETALHDRRVEYLRSRLTLISKSKKSVEELTPKAEELAAALGKVRSQIQEALSNGQAAGQEIKGSSLNTQVPDAQIDLALMHALQNNGFPLRGVGNDPDAQPVSHWTDYTMDGIANEVKRLSRTVPELAEALKAEGL